jgi:hypothetical protein
LDWQEGESEQRRGAEQQSFTHGAA